MLSIRNMAKTTIQIDGMHIYIHFFNDSEKKSFQFFMYKNVTEE